MYLEFYHTSVMKLFTKIVNGYVVNTFVPNANIRKPFCFQVVEKGCIGSEWVNAKNLHHSCLTEFQMCFCNLENCVFIIKIETIQSY